MKAANAKTAAGARFGVAALRKLAGDKVFERGEDYHADGQVEILSLEPKRVLAQVAGRRKRNFMKLLQGHRTHAR